MAQLEGAANLVSNASLVALATAAYAPVAAIGGMATLSAILSGILRSSIALSGEGVAFAETGLRFDGEALISGQSNLTAQAQYLVRSSLQGSGSLTAEISLLIGTTVDLSGFADVSGNSRLSYAGASGLTAEGVQAVEARVSYRAAAALSGQATVQGRALGPFEGAADLVGVSGLTAQASVSYSSGGYLFSDSYLYAYPIVYNPLVQPPQVYSLGVWVNPYAGLRPAVQGSQSAPSNTLVLTPKGPEID